MKNRGKRAMPAWGDAEFSQSRRSVMTQVKMCLARTPYHRRIQALRKALGWSDDQWLRVVMNHETARLVSAIDTRQFDVLEISGSSWKERIPHNTFSSFHFPDFDICNTFISDKYNLIIAEQVFEHVLWPYKAGRNVYRMLRAGGYFLITTPFLVRVHAYPTDCTRWTEQGLKHYLAECGFPIDGIVTGSWGNKSCVKRNLETWVRFNRFFCSLNNETDFPCSVWALAYK